MRGLTFLGLCLGLFGCSVSEPNSQGPYPSADLNSLNDLGIRCMQDAGITYFERSEHCVLVAEGLTATNEEHCSDWASNACRAWQDINYAYLSAVADSLLTHGRSPQLMAMIEKEGSWLLHRRDELMRALFKECLRKEQEALAKKGLQRIHSVMVHPLAEDQKCIRNGGERFETAPL